jgi:hypothetical protein
VITKDWTLPEVIAKYPGTRRVFDDAGLHGCGGASGPRETVEFFSRVHGIPLEKLLADLDAAKNAPAALYREELGDVLYRRFFRAAIGVILTAGATLGASMLFLYGLRHSFTSLDLFPPIQAHANAQVFGWVGLFVMGFACQGLPRFKYVRLWRPEVANLSFILMLFGLGLRMGAAWTWFGQVAVGLAGGVLQAISGVLFVTVMARTIQGSRSRDDWDKYVVFSLVSFGAVAVLEPVVFYLTRPGIEPGELIDRVATYMGPYRTLQLLGFAGFMILGVSQRILPTAFGFRPPGRRVANVTFALLATGLAVDLAGWGLFRVTRAPAWAVASWLGTSAYALGAILLAVSLRAFTGGDPDRSRKFIRAAYLWLAVACLMTMLEPFYAHALGLRFSHAYHGAIRHAFTVGFISLMILGVSSKVVPILGGIETRSLPALLVPFVLVNAGNAIRVLFQVLTDVLPGVAFPIMGASGALEVAGLFVWGVHLWGLLARRPSDAPVEHPPSRITAEMRVSDVAEWYPGLLDVFERFGFKELRNPFLRRTIARRVTLRMACDLKHVPEEAFLKALNESLDRKDPGPEAPLPRENEAPAQGCAGAKGIQESA